MSFGFETEPNSAVNIKVVGVGGGGNNVVNRMVLSGTKGVDFVAVNTDKQALDASNATFKLQIGEKLTHGKGAGAKPDVGRKAAEENRSQLSTALENTDMVFVTCGMGGGTGTGGSPIVADVARELGILTVGVVTKPFAFEGKVRMRQAEEGITELKNKVDALVIIPNERLKMATDQKITLANAFEIADDVLRQAVESISDLIQKVGVINLDFADVTSVMKDAGLAHMGVGRAAGENKAKEAAKLAVSSPLLETSINGAKGVLINITSGKDIGLDEVDTAVTLVQQAAHPEANIIFGSIFDENMEDEMRVTVIATGFDDADEEPEVPSFSQISSQVTQQEPAPAPVPEPTPAPAPQTPQESFFQAVEFDPFSTATQQKAAPAPEQPKAAPAKKDPFDDLMEMFNRRK